MSLHDASVSKVKAPVSRTDIRNYDVKLGLFTESEWVRGVVNIQFAPTSKLDLDLSGVDVLSVSEKKGRRVVVSPGGISLDDPTLVMDELRIVYRSKFGGGLRKKDGFVYTAFHTTDWMPAHFAPHDRAKFRISLRMPRGYKAVAPGELVSHREIDGQVEWVYGLEREYPAYILGFAAGRFEEYIEKREDTNHRILHRGFSKNELGILVDKADSALAFFAEVSGVLHPSPSYSQVWVKDRVAQELADMATMNAAFAESMFEEPKEDWMLVHEISHQWWGNSVTCETWSDFWINEAFAVFMVAAYKERIWGRAAYDREIELAQKRLGRLKESGKDGPLKLDAGAKSSDAGGPVPYVKGILLMDELRSRMGDDAFWSGIRNYTKAHWLNGASTEDFREAMQRETPVDVRDSFHRWGALF